MLLITFILLFCIIVFIGDTYLEKFLTHEVSKGNYTIEIKDPLMKFSAKWIDATTGWGDNKLVETSSGKLVFIVDKEVIDNND